MDSSLKELQQMFEYELKRKLSEKAKTTSGEMRLLLNGFKFFDLNYTGIIDKSKWIQGIFRTGLSGFSESDLDSLFSVYDLNNSGQIDYKNFCAFLYGREPLNPLSNQSIQVQQNNNMNQVNQYQENQNQNQNMNMNNINQANQYNNNYSNQQNNQMRNYSNDNSNNNRNYNNYNQRTPMNNYNNQNNTNFRNTQRTPLNNFNNYDDYQDNTNFRQSQRNINSYNNTFNNIFQQESSSTSNNSINRANLSGNSINAIISTIKNNINTNYGITLYNFIKNLRNKQSNNSGISLDDLHSIFQEMRINISLSDLSVLFNVLNGNENKIISSEQLINLIKGNLDERRKLYIIGIFANLDTEKKGEVTINFLKSKYNAKKHPDVLNGTKSQEEAFEQFCYSLDLYCELYGLQKNGSLSFENFVDYYSGVSSCIPDDVYFEDMLNGVWNSSNGNNNLTANINYNINLDNLNNNGINNLAINNKNVSVQNNSNINQNDNQFNNNGFNNNRFSNTYKFNNNNFNNNQFNNNSYNNNNNFKNNRRMKNSISTPFIDDNISINKQNNNIQSNNNYNNNVNNYSNTQTSNYSNTIPVGQKLNTPFNNPRRSPEGIKVFHNKRRYNPILDEYYNDSDYQASNNKNNINNTNSNFSTDQNSYNNTNNNMSNNNDYNFNNKNDNSQSPSGIIEQLRNVLISRGSKSIFTFQRMLSIYDRNHSGQISLDDLTTIFQTYNLNFSNTDIQNIFQMFDTNQTGLLNYDQLLKNIIGEMNERRILSVKKVFDNFNVNEKGEVSISEIKQKYNSGRHPDVVNEKKNKEEVYGEFLDKLEIFREYNDNLKASFSSSMTFSEFAMFYNEISMNIRDDNLFDYLLNNCWDLDRMIGNNKYNNLNYINNNNNGNTISYGNYDRNIRARTGKQIMNMNNKPY